MITIGGCSRGENGAIRENAQWTGDRCRETQNSDFPITEQVLGFANESDDSIDVRECLSHLGRDLERMEPRGVVEDL
jgi:hypothetical protein